MGNPIPSVDQSMGKLVETKYIIFLEIIFRQQI